MPIQDGDKLFVYLNGSLPKPPRYAAFGFALGTLSDFDNYIFGYKEAVNQLYKRFSDSSSDEIDVHDTLVFPLCFLYRHMIELYIKFIYIKYANVSEDECRTFLNEAGHHLNAAWRKTRPFLQNLLDRFPSSRFSLDLCRQMIEQVDAFDGESMRMRYPITKRLSSTNPTPILLDVVHLHAKMMDLVDYFDSINRYFDNVLIGNEADPTFCNRFMREIGRGKTIFARICDAVDRYQPVSDGQSGCSLVDIADVQDEESPLERELAGIVQDADINHIVTIMMLLYTGRDLVGHRFKLSETSDHRANDLLKGLELTQQELGNLGFDQYDTNKWDVCEKLLISEPRCLRSWLSQIRTSWNLCFSDNMI